ncbi:hypothetical protein SDC9_189080 [bioreactor metagenome]|uniref:Uncharacterized protein n=1 Tax=bioreactor metagenome TaxID=1076179 RepID=A0A645HR50_9ZZZZ
MQNAACTCGCRDGVIGGCANRDGAGIVVIGYRTGRRTARIIVGIVKAAVVTA